MPRTQETGKAPTDTPTSPKRSRRLRFAIILIACALGFAGWVWMAIHSPTSLILLPEHGAEWIRVDEPVNLVAQDVLENGVGFRVGFTRRQSAPSAVLTVRAMKNVTVYLDGKEIYADAPGFDDWRRLRQIGLPPDLPTGVHLLEFVIRTKDCHPAMLAYCEALGIRSGTSWEATLDGVAWLPAMLASSQHTPEIADRFPPTYRALLRIAPWLVSVFGAVGAWTVLHDHRGWQTPNPSTMRWVMLAIWGILAVNNISKLPTYCGMDIEGHLAYLKCVAEEGRIPLATEGWQMFQPPLYYLVSAPLYWCSSGSGPEALKLWLRVVPLLCGIAQVELSYQALRAVVPNRTDLQIAGTALGAFLPMNLYISQVIGNEPLAGALSSLAIVMVLHQAQNGQSVLTRRFMAILGLVLGLALLAKASSLLLVPLLTGACIWSSVDRARRVPEAYPIRRAVDALAFFGGTIGLVAGWFYLRNWLLLGKPFVGGWDPSRGMAWWQDPSYITPSSLVDFGRALIHPVYAQIAGFWDGLYCTLWLDGTLGSETSYAHRPPWNYDFVLSGALLALIPCTAMVLGLVSRIHRNAAMLSLACIAVYVGANLHLYAFVLPAFSTIKATYMLGLVPCFAILTALGLGALPKNVWVRAAAHGLLASWATSAYLGYFIT